MPGTRRAFVAGVGGSAVAIDHDDVLEVVGPVQSTPVPHAPGPVCGVAVIGGEMVTLVDVRRLMGQPPGDPAAGVTVLVGDGAGRVGLVVDEVGDVTDVADTGVAGESRPFLIPSRDTAGASLLRVDTAAALDFGGGRA